MMPMMIHAALLLSLVQQPEPLRTVEEFGLRIAPGFKITLVADHTLANDIYAMDVLESDVTQGMALRAGTTVKALRAITTSSGAVTRRCRSS